MFSFCEIISRLYAVPTFFNSIGIQNDDILILLFNLSVVKTFAYVLFGYLGVESL